MENLIILGFSVFLATNSFAASELKPESEEATFETFEAEQAPQEQVESLTNRKDLRMYENPRNPAMVKGFQSVDSTKGVESSDK